MNGISAVYGVNETTTENAQGSQDIIDSIRKSAEEASKSITDAVDQSGLREKAQSIWNGIVDYFR